MESAKTVSQVYCPSQRPRFQADTLPDLRTEQDSFAYGKVDPHEAGKLGGHTSGSTGSDGSSSGGFAHGKVDPVEAGRKGGKSS